MQRETLVFPDPLVVLGSPDPRETVASPASQDPKATADPRAPQDQPIRAPREAAVPLDPRDEEVCGGDSKILHIYLSDRLLPGLVTRLVQIPGYWSGLNVWFTCLVKTPGYRSGSNSWLSIWFKQLVTGLVQPPGYLSGLPVWFKHLVYLSGSPV